MNKLKRQTLKKIYKTDYQISKTNNFYKVFKHFFIFDKVCNFSLFAFNYVLWMNTIMMLKDRMNDDTYNNVEIFQP